MVMELIRAASPSRGRFFFWYRPRRVLLFPTSFLTHEPLLFVTEQNIEGGKAAVDTGDILLQVHFFFVAQTFVAVDLLFQDPEPVTGHDDLVKEDVDGNFLRLDGIIGGAEDQGAASPFVA